MSAVFTPEARDLFRETKSFMDGVRFTPEKQTLRQNTVIGTSEAL
ncbi:hypothetical protein LAB1_21920 [Roseibium sp. LAB1]